MNQKQADTVARIFGSGKAIRHRVENYWEVHIPKEGDSRIVITKDTIVEYSTYADLTAASIIHLKYRSTPIERDAEHEAVHAVLAESFGIKLVGIRRDPGTAASAVIDYEDIDFELQSNPERAQEYYRTRIIVSLGPKFYFPDDPHEAFRYEGDLEQVDRRLANYFPDDKDCIRMECEEETRSIIQSEVFRHIVDSIIPTVKKALELQITFNGVALEGAIRRAREEFDNQEGGEA